MATRMSAETRQAIEAAARRAADSAVKKTLLTMGVDVSTPAELRELQQDMAFLRTLRLLSGKRSARVIIIIVSTLATFVGALALFIVQKAFGGP